MHVNEPPHIRAARDFYDGMAQAVHEAGSHFIPLAQQEFALRDAGDASEQAFSKSIELGKLMHQSVAGVPRAPLPHAVLRFKPEFFACVSALNLHRLPDYTEQFKAELLMEHFFRICAEREMEWLGVYDATLPGFEKETGHSLGQWRIGLVKRYLPVLERRSSRDADVLVAVHHFLEHMQLSKSRNLPVSPALLEKLAHALEQPAGWLEHYLRFHPF